MSSINNKLSKTYGIRDLGLFGSEIIRDGKQIFKSTSKASKFENWQECLNYARTHIGLRHRDSDPVLIYITDVYGEKVRINEKALNDPDRHIIPIYNRLGDKIVDSKTYDGDKGKAFIHKANIPGTPEHKESQAEAAQASAPAETAEPDPESFPKVKGAGAAQYTFDLQPGEQLSLF
jgi:hypothetical protein